MRLLPPLKAMQAFDAVARLGSFAAASEELHLTPSAISHQIRRLEERLEITLFHRIHRGVELSDAGRAFAEVIATAFGQIEASARSIERAGKSDILTVHSVPSFATQWLMPRLSRFSSLNPDIDVRLNASATRIDLASGEADVDIRYGNIFPGGDETVVAFPKETIVVAGAPALVGRRRRGRATLDMSRVTLIHSEVNRYSWRDWARDHGHPSLELARGPRFDRSFMAISAAVDGLGIALESRLLIERELAAGALVLPFGLEGPQIVCHRLVYLKTKLRTRKVTAFKEWLFEELQASMGQARVAGDGR